MRITQKLGILVAVPLCAVSGFGALALVTSTSGAIETGHLYTLMNAGAAAADLVCELQDERTQVALYLTGAAGTDASALNAQIAKTQAAAGVYRDRIKGMPWLAAESRALLVRIDGELQAIDKLRDLVRGGSPQALSAADFQYHIVVADLLAFHDVAQKSGAGSAAQDMLRATSSLSQARESLSEEEADVLRIAGAPVQTASAAQDLIIGRTGYTGAMEAFAAQAPPDWRGRPDQALGGAQMATAGELEDQVAQTPVGTKVHLDPKAWTGAMDTRLDRLDGVRKDMDLATLALIAQDRTHQRELAGVEAAAVAGTMLLAVMVSLRLGRPIIRGLRRLRDGAHTLAFEDLPAAVQALRGSGSLTAQSAEEFADQAAGGLPVSGDDEIAAVARAFNAVRHEAIRTAAEQVLLRAGVGAAFIALARRGERLTGALTLELDKAERDEQDPDRLARLFVLDHLAARMTRNNESLLVLGGEGTARVRDEGVPLIDVIRAASGRIERYSRVDLVNVDSGIMIAPTVVDHLVHLCAELLDNATTFSPPETRVLVDVRALADRTIIQITDRGIGMTAVRRSELNARLITPPSLDAISVQAMGLTVVGQLASWYGLDVELRPHPQNGTIAELVLPPSLYWAPGMPEAGPTTPVAAIESLAAGMGRPGGEHARPNEGVRAAVTAAAAAAAAGVTGVSSAAGGRRRRTGAAPGDSGLNHAVSDEAGYPRHAGRPQPIPVPTMGATGQYNLSSLDQNPVTVPGAPGAGSAGTAPMPGSFAMPGGAQDDAYPPAPIRARQMNGSADSAMPPAAQPAAAEPEPPLSPWLRGSMRTRDSSTQQTPTVPQQQAPPPAEQATAPWARSASAEPPAPVEQPAASRSQQSAAHQAAGSPVEQAAPAWARSARPVAQPAIPAPQPLTPTTPPAPAQSSSSAAKRAPIKLRTTHGLPKRVPLDRLPVEALADLSDDSGAPAERDPSRVSASMAAYARGIGGRAGTGAVSQIPYSPSSNTGTHQ